ncbi:hypothetical protein CHS0354_008675, partial [Potamilus streckersoni]
HFYDGLDLAYVEFLAIISDEGELLQYYGRTHELIKPKGIGVATPTQDIENLPKVSINEFA